MAVCWLATEIYVLVANAESIVGGLEMTLLFEDGTTVAKIWLGNPANSRITVNVGSNFRKLRASDSGFWLVALADCRFRVLSRNR